MGKLLYVASILAGSQGINALTCYSCTANLNSLGATLGQAGSACWNPTTTAPSNGIATPEVTTNCERCTASIEFQDGWPLSITRGCETTATVDTVTYSAETCNVKSGSSNFAVLFGSLTEDNGSSPIADLATCQADCTTDNCNSNFQLTDITVCSQIQDYTGKWCDFTTGTWKCLAGTTIGGVATNTADPGSNDQCLVPTATTVTPTFLSCVQCNSMTDSTCWTKSTATACENSDATYTTCYSQTSLFYDRHTGALLRENIVRGCSNVASSATGANLPDQCYWSDAENTITSAGSITTFDTEIDTESSIDHAHELICNTNCDTSGCNTVIPNGDNAAAEDVIFCAVYDSATDATVKSDTDFESMLFACPSGTTGCYSSVTYLTRDHNDQMLPGDYENRVRVVSHQRGCMSDSVTVTDSCVEDTAYAPSTAGKVNGAAVTKHTCSSSCLGSNCNNHNWPARPKCLQSDSTSAAPVASYANPATACPTPAEDTCFIYETNFITPKSKYLKDDNAENIWEVAAAVYVDSGINIGFNSAVMRGCVLSTDNFIETGCNKEGHRGTSGRLEDQFFESCNFTCTNDACNWGSAYSSGFMKLASPVLLAVALLFKNL